MNGAPQDTAVFNNELAFRLGAAEAGNSTDPLFAATACAMDVCEIVIEGTVKSDTEVQQAISDLAAQRGITLS